MSTAPASILKDEGLVLRWFPVTDSSRVVVWFTASHGRMSTLIKGSQRPKSWMLGQFDLFYTCELLFYSRAKEDLFILRECSSIEPRSWLRTQWRHCLLASFVSDILYRFTPPRAQTPGLYVLATDCLNELQYRPASPVFLFWFELRVYRELGILPNLSTESHSPLFFDYPSGRITPRPASAQAGSISPGTLRCMQRIANSPDADSLSGLKLLPAQISELEEHLDKFTRWHLDHPLPSRKLTLQRLREPGP